MLDCESENKKLDFILGNSLDYGNLIPIGYFDKQICWLLFICNK